MMGLVVSARLCRFTIYCRSDYIIIRFYFTADYTRAQSKRFKMPALNPAWLIFCRQVKRSHTIIS